LAPLLSKIFLKLKIKIPHKNWLFLMMPLSILVHLAVSNMTLMTRNFVDTQGHFFLKGIVLLSLFLGLRGIKKVS